MQVAQHRKNKKKKTLKMYENKETSVQQNVEMIKIKILFVSSSSSSSSAGAEQVG